MLIEGETYHFKILRAIELPDNTGYWVLTHNGSDRYMIPTDNYRGYNMKPGKVFACLVDKINCTGQIFIEPKHPFYQEGERYIFRFLRRELLTDKLGNKLCKYSFNGLNNEVLFYLSNNETHKFDESESVEVEVKKIKKGSVDFVPLGVRDVLIKGKLYQFNIDKTSSENTILLKGPYGIYAKIDPKLYLNYNFVAGAKISVWFLGWVPEGVPIVEPEHPIYQPGKIYPFEVIGSEKIVKNGIFENLIFVVTDCFGNKVKVFSDGYFNQTTTDISSIRCRVVRLKKGKPVLKILQ